MVTLKRETQDVDDVEGEEQHELHVDDLQEGWVERIHHAEGRKRGWHLIGRVLDGVVYCMGGEVLEVAMKWMFISMSKTAIPKKILRERCINPEYW